MKSSTKNLEFLKDKLIAHRGIHISVPENSMKAFNEAVKKGYTIEFDVHLLKDDTIVIFHDDNLERMTGVDKDLKDCTYSDIEDLKLLGSKNKIPRLDEVLKTIDGKVPIIIELKFDRKVGLLEKELVKQLDNYRGTFCVKSFDPLIVRWFRKHRPSYIRGLLLSSKKDTLIEKIVHSNLMFKLCKPDFVSCDYRLSNDKKIKRHKNTMPVLAWTINNDKDYKKYKNEFHNLIVDVYK